MRRLLACGKAVRTMRMPHGRQLPGSTAIARRGPPLPPLIFIGSAYTVAPRAGSASSPVRFSKAGMLRSYSRRCDSNSVDCP